jgi:hypothetical protein
MEDSMKKVNLSKRRENLDAFSGFVLVCFIATAIILLACNRSVLPLIMAYAGYMVGSCAYCVLLKDAIERATAAESKLADIRRFTQKEYDWSQSEFASTLLDELGTTQ